MRSLILITVACLLLGSSPATGAPTLELTVTPGPASTTVVLDVTNDAGERPEILGFHIYREEFTGENQLPENGGYGICTESIRLTKEALLRPFGPASYSFEIEDGALSADRAYRYFVEGSPRFVPPWDWQVGFDIEKSSVALTTGPTLIATSARVWESAGVDVLAPCGCYAWVDRILSLPGGIANTNQVWTLFGTIQPRADGNGFELVVDAAEPQDWGCLDFAVESSNWGTVKRLYR